MPDLYLSGDTGADRLLSEDANALVIGMVLDQQVPLETAFAGPAVLASRIGGQLDVAAIVATDPEEFAAICAERPAIHRFPGSMAKRIQGACQVLLEQYGGNATNLWATAENGAELHRRVSDLPGFGAQKASIFVALLGKQYGVTPPGWREAAGPYGEDGVFRSVADITDPESLVKVREAKRAAKAQARTAAES